MKKLHIAFVRQKYNPYGGAERFVERALAALSGSKIDVTVLARKWTAGNTVYRFISCNPFYLGRLWRDRSFCKSVCKRLEDLSVDIVQSHERIPCTDIYRAGDGVHKVWLSQKSSVGGIWFRLFHFLSPYHRYVLSAEKKMFESPRLKAVICNSRMVKNEIIEHFDIDEEKLHLIYSGVDTDHFHPGLRDSFRDDMRRKYGLTRDDRVLLFVGSGFFRKGLCKAIEAVSIQKGEIFLVVVGHDRHSGRYKKLAQRLGLQEKVIFTGPQDDVAPFYSMADVFILPSLYDPFPNAVLEAMACGLPVITSNKTGAAEFIDSGVEGYVIDSMDKVGIADAIELMFVDDKATQMGIKARNKVEAYDIQSMSDRLVDFYSSIIENKY